ncbi:hypothetical protein TNCT_139041 [Trichonephila clavata]|uniref:Uncharacterized protein n=1 Tax=Trichonephila clavata TaxID=2740835 RepID=A0A8X6GHV0_TRICU|nr:hypothetical protein TNCT_139041 [Trichonephila clavata]
MPLFNLTQSNVSRNYKTWMWSVICSLGSRIFFYNIPAPLVLGIQIPSLSKGIHRREKEQKQQHINQHNVHVVFGEPSCTQSRAAQQPFLVNVLSSILGGHLIGPYFLPTPLDGWVYLLITSTTRFSSSRICSVTAPLHVVPAWRKSSTLRNSSPRKTSQRNR